MKTKFADNFKRLRKDKGVTQEKLAEILNVSSQSVSRWELGVCYPDIELIPAIANYFGVSTDILLLNDSDSKTKDKEHFYATVNNLDYGSTEQLDFVRSLKNKYPDDIEYIGAFVNVATACILCNNGNDNLFSEIENAVLELKDTAYWNGALIEIIRVCDDKDLEKWLSMCPYESTQNRRGALVTRYACRKDYKLMYIHQGLEAIEKYAVQLDRRFPDEFGPTKKAEYQRRILRIIENFGDGKNPPDAWKLFYAYKQLVLAACLFGDGKTKEGWAEFGSAIEKYHYIFEIQDEYLEAGSEMFSSLKINKIWTKAIDPDGNEYKLFGAANYSFYSAKFLYYFLTNKRWAWFDSVRETPEYCDAVDWAKSLINLCED